MFIFGSVTLHNPQGNHYTLGLAPITTINGQANGNIITFGILYGVNDVKRNSEVKRKMSSYGLIIGFNGVGENSQVENMSAVGLVGGINTIRKHSAIKWNMSAVSLGGGVNQVRQNSKITGNIYSKWLIVSTPISIGLGSNSEIGLKDYIVPAVSGNKY